MKFNFCPVPPGTLVSHGGYGFAENEDFAYTPQGVNVGNGTIRENRRAYK